MYKFVDSKGVHREEHEFVHRVEINDYRTSDYRISYIILTEFYAGKKV